MVLTFGWVGSPGEYQISGTAAKKYHQAHRPSNPDFSAEIAFNSHYNVDDQVYVELLMGDGPWQSIACGERGMQSVMGEAALNRDKDAEEGQMEARKRLLGARLRRRLQNH